MRGGHLSEVLLVSLYKADVWRLVEAQHRVSTLKLTDTLNEQALLETLLDETKPMPPPECEGLDYLLAAPFRYGPYPYGSRFRRAGRTEGVFYASDKVETAVAELAFYRLLFYAESPQTPFPDAPTDYSAFSVPIRTSHALDVSAPQFADLGLQSPNDYNASQAFADRARAEGIEVIRYQSVRHPMRGMNAAVLTPRAFAAKKPKAFATWRIKVGRTGVIALGDFSGSRLSFERNAFAADPRLDGFNWQR